MFSISCACFWMFNDCWPATRSWTVVDHALRRTPSFYPVKRSFAPVHVVLANEDNGIRIYGINEHQARESAQLRFGVFDLQGKYLYDENKEVVLPPNASTLLASFPQDRLPNDAAAFAILRKAGKVVARNRLFLQKFRDMQWPAASVSVKVSDGIARFSSEVFTWGICLDLNGEHPLADNFFDLYPQMEYAIPWEGSAPPRILHLGNLTEDECKDSPQLKQMSVSILGFACSSSVCRKTVSYRHT